MTPLVHRIASQVGALLGQTGPYDYTNDNAEDFRNTVESGFNVEQGSSGSSSKDRILKSALAERRNLKHVESTIQWIGDGRLNDELDRINYPKVLSSWWSVGDLPNP